MIIRMITRSLGVYPLGSSQIGVDLSDSHPSPSQIGVGFMYMGADWRAVHGPCVNLVLILRS